MYVPVDNARACLRVGVGRAELDVSRGTLSKFGNDGVYPRATFNFSKFEVVPRFDS